MSKIKQSLAALMMLVFFCNQVSQAEPHGTVVGEKAPNFTLSLTDGKKFRLSDYRTKKALYLIFWATWCPNCKKEIPRISKWHEKFKDDVEFLAINTGINDSLRKVERYIKSHKMPYYVAFDEGSRVTQLFQVVGTPTQVIIDINGVVRYRAAEAPDNLDTKLSLLLSK